MATIPFPPIVDPATSSGTSVVTTVAGRSQRAGIVYPSVQQARSTLFAPVFAVGQTTGFEPLVIDLGRAPKPGEHWILDSVTCSGLLATSAPPSGPNISPVSGLFLIPQNTLPEVLADAQTAPGFDLRARGIPLPVSAQIVALGPGGYGFVLFYMGVSGRTIPTGWTVRAIVNCNPGSLTPGPGPNSSGELVAIVAPELDMGVLV
jgi:hypothetical protein